jgi:hypothetical protein
MGRGFKLAGISWTRMVRAWTQADRDALAKKDRDEEQALWDLMRMLGSRFNGCFLDTERLDCH